jgi:hypothetical protein
MNTIQTYPWDAAEHLETKEDMGLPENKIPNKKIEKCFFEKVIIFV